MYRAKTNSERLLEQVCRSDLNLEINTYIPNNCPCSKQLSVFYLQDVRNHGLFTGSIIFEFTGCPGLTEFKVKKKKV